MGSLRPEQRAASDKTKVSGNSLPEINTACKQATIDLRDDPDIRDAARGALATGNLVNAFVLWCLGRPVEERKRISMWGLRALERLKDSPVPIDLRALSQESFDALGEPDDGAHAAKPTVTIGRGSRGPKKAQKAG